MRIVIAGAHGQIARIVGRRLASRGDDVLGIIRKPEQAEDLEADGTAPVVLDLEASDSTEVAEVLAGADAVVFAAGAGPGSGVARKHTVDHAAADLVTAAAEAAGVRRLIQISAMGTSKPPQDDAVFSHYLRAKAAAEETLRDTALDYVILRPGRLTDESETGMVHLATSVSRGAITRGDVAAVIVALLDKPTVRRTTLDLVAGDVPVHEAVGALADSLR